MAEAEADVRVNDESIESPKPVSADETEVVSADETEIVSADEIEVTEKPDADAGLVYESIEVLSNHLLYHK